MPGRLTEDSIKRTAAAAGAAMANDFAWHKPRDPGPGSGDRLKAATALEACLSRIEPRVAQSFDADQLRALEVMLDLRQVRRHAVDFRRSFSLGSARYYAALFVGREHRNLIRRAEPRRRRTKAGGWIPWALLVLLGALYLVDHAETLGRAGTELLAYLQF